MTRTRFIRQSKYRILAIAVCAVSAVSIFMICSNINRSVVIDASKGQWVFVPRVKGSHVSPEGLTDPDQTEYANDVFPNDLKTYTDNGAWISLSDPSIEIPKNSEPHIPEGINWGTLDCGFHGPKFESRAFGCDRPGKLYIIRCFQVIHRGSSCAAGGCGVKPVIKRSNTLSECGSDSHACISVLKKCLISQGTTGTSKPSYGEAHTDPPTFAEISSHRRDA